MALIGGLALTVTAFAAEGKGQAAQKQSKTMSQPQTKQRLKAGSRSQMGTMVTRTQAGKTYGLGEGTGIQGVDQRTGWETERQSKDRT